MNPNYHSHPSFSAKVAGLSLIVGLLFSIPSATADDAPVFSSAAADLGIVASDLEKSVAFYRDVIGCTEVKGFSVPPAFATSLGLVDQQAVTARVLVLGEGKTQTKLKLMEFPAAGGKKSDQKFIHSSFGFSYLTLHVNDLNASIERLKKAGVKLEGQTPVPLGGNNALLVCRDPDGNFVELIGPR